jgi:6-phosphogluconolactonase (cycloisomerase 2 family)
MVAEGQQGPVYEFKIDTSTGLFTQISGSPFKADVGSPAQVCTVGCGASLLADPLDRYLYLQYNYGGAADTATNAVDSLSVNAADGTLSSNSKVLQSAYEMSADPQGRFIYWNATNGVTNAVGAFDVSTAGQLTAAPGQPYTYNGQTSYGAPAETGTYVFAVNYRNPTTTSQGELVEWTIDPVTGALTQTSHTLPLVEGAGPIVSPNGKFLYVQQAYLNNGAFNWEILPIQIGADGSFTPLTQNVQQTPSAGDSDMWMSPNGNFLYISVYGQIWDYQIDQTTGALTLIQKYTDVNTNTLAIDPAVKYVFLSPEGQNQVGTTTLTAYAVNPTTGALTPVAKSTVDVKVTPISLAVVSPK